MYKPDDKISRKEIAEQLEVSTRTVIRYEEYGFLPKGQRIKGAGPDIWYEMKDFLSLKRRIKN